MLLVGLTAATAAPEQIVAGLAKLDVNVGLTVTTMLKFTVLHVAALVAVML